MERSWTVKVQPQLSAVGVLFSIIIPKNRRLGLFIQQRCLAYTWVMSVSLQCWPTFHDTIYFACFMAEPWNFYLTWVILHPQNSPIDFMGPSRLPMKATFIVSLMFLLYGPKHQADLQGGSVLLWAKQLLFLCFSLMILASLPAALWSGRGNTYGMH